MIGATDRFRALVAQRLGLQFEDAKLGFLATVLDRRTAALSVDVHRYLVQLERDPASDEIAALAQELTVGETYLFRNINQFHALAALLPELARRGSLQILSAGCASGDEAYTIGIVAQQTRVPVAIRAVDLNPAILERAARARFTSWSMRETPADLKDAWFRPDGRDLVIAERVRELVRFERRNLAVEDPELWQPNTYAVVFCRNVLMYFTPEVMRAVVARIERSLVPGGYLFVGHAETLRGLSQGFRLCHTHETFYYQRREAPETSSEPARELVELAPDVGWVDAIQSASERIKALATPAAPPPREHAAPASDRAASLQLLRDERFADALALLQRESARDAESLLLEGVLLVHCGQLASAEATCRRLLELDEFDAGARYVLALCREGVGDDAGAAEHDQIAAYLDPSFAMPHLHLGLVARRRGDRETSRRELGIALHLLEREDAARLLLFGGGFHRESLIALCKTELAKR